MSYFQLIVMAISLSMDAFSLAIVYGTVLPTKRIKIFLSLMVGIFHYFMPILGNAIGIFIVNNIVANSDLLVSLIFLILSLEMILNLKDKNIPERNFRTYIDALFFAFSVSVDSFSVGIALGTHHENIYLKALFFTLFSTVFTYLGLNMGQRLSKKYGNLANILGSIFLFILAIYHLVT